MAVINTNVAATLTANALSRNDRAATQAMERLSTGLKINSAADDAAGMAMSNTMTAQVKGLNMAVKNANDAISMIQTADGASIEIGDMLQRMRELAVQANNGTLTDADRTQLNLEYQELETEITRVGAQTEWNGTALIDDSAGTSGVVTYQIGDTAQTMTVDFGDLQAGGDLGLNTSTDTIATATGAAAAITSLDTAIVALNTQRATYGAAINRLEHTVDNLSNVSMNTQAALSRIQDADYAAESTELARTQIVAQAGTAMLAQANQQAQSVLALLK
jgi:flagellin